MDVILLALIRHEASVDILAVGALSYSQHKIPHGVIHNGPAISEDRGPLDPS